MLYCKIIISLVISILYLKCLIFEFTGLGVGILALSLIVKKVVYFTFVKWVVVKKRGFNPRFSLLPYPLGKEVYVLFAHQ